MSLQDSEVSVPPSAGGGVSSAQGRDSQGTRRRLIGAARHRFASQGYASTTVREIAADAGVNVALINRYFTSKEGLFEACMLRTSDELDSRDSGRTVEEVVASLVAHVAHSPGRDDPLQLLLLLRSSGDANAEHIRRRTLERFTEALASDVGWRADDPLTAPILLRAQIAIATLLGTVMLRTTAAAEPIATADPVELADSVSLVLRTLLSP